MQNKGIEHTIIRIMGCNCTIPARKLSVGCRILVGCRTDQSDRTTNFMPLWSGGYGRLLSGAGSDMVDDDGRRCSVDQRLDLLQIGVVDPII